MSGRTIRRLLGAGALVAAFGLATLAPAGAQEGEAEEESHELDHAVEECIHELEEANSIDVNCQQAPNPLVPEKNELIWGAFGFVVVFVAEHFVRPVLIGGSTRLPFLLVLFGILGGAETFGLLGLFIGPALMTVLMVLWNDWVR